jgi:hypothetical protein
MSAGHDPREQVYGDLHQQLDENERFNRASAGIILPLLFERIEARCRPGRRSAASASRTARSSCA